MPFWQHFCARIAVPQAQNLQMSRYLKPYLADKKKYECAGFFPMSAQGVQRFAAAFTVLCHCLNSAFMSENQPEIRY